jgi:hypothetical protein
MDDNQDSQSNHSSSLIPFFIGEIIILCYGQLILEREHGGLEANTMFLYVRPVLVIVPCPVQSPDTSYLLLPLPYVNEVAGYGGSGGHFRAGEVGSAACALASFEVAV